MAAAGRFDYLLIESTGLWKACVTCLVTVLVNGCTTAARYVSQASLESAQTKVFCQTARYMDHVGRNCADA